MKRAFLVAATAAAVWFRVGETIPYLHLIGIAALLIGGWPILREAVENMLERRMTMELSMSIAIAAAAAIGELLTALVIALFVLVAEELERRTVARGRHAIRELLTLLPQTAAVRRGGAVLEVRVSELRAGDRVLVAPGARISADGLVAHGSSFVDEAAITGEPMPVAKRAGSPVYAGTINQLGALELHVERLGADTRFGKIVEAVERAERSRAPVQKLADRLAGYLVTFALGSAVLTFIVTCNVRSTISVVIVAGACGIAAGTPLAILGGIGQAARKGAIVKGGLFLEALATVDTVVLDKTGTLTYGRPDVRAILPRDGVSPRTLLEAAAIAERRSEHPLGRAVVARADAEGIPRAEPERFSYEPGKGTVAMHGAEELVAGSRDLLRGRGVDVPDGPREVEGTSEVMVARGGRLLGTILVADTLRADAPAAVRMLKEMKLRTLLLTGDAASAALPVGRELGVDEMEAGLLPAEKLDRVERLIATGRRVAMVGDGINDAPALTAATVGVAMGSGTEVARESADIVLLGNDLTHFVEALRIARRTRRVILQNFVGTLVVDGVGVGLAAFGFLNPLLAAFIHVASELVFIGNSALLLPRVSAPGRLSSSPFICEASRVCGTARGFSYRGSRRVEAADT